MTMKKRHALFGVLLIGALLLYTLAAYRSNWLKTSISKILLSIFRERYSETGLMKNSPTDITASSRPFGFCKRLFSWDTCDPVRNNKSPWFVQRFNASIQPMWPLSQPISQEAFNWWTKLQKSNASYKYLQSTLIQLQKLVPRNTRVLFKKTKMMGECTRCAVIGNSQILSGSGLGKIIDCHDYVFRINVGPVKGFENDVGSLTTHRFIYPASAPSIPSGVGVIFIPFKVEHVLWLENALNTSNNARKSKQMKKLASVDKDKVIIYNPVFLYYIHHKWAERNGLYPSTGLAATMFALHICDKVNLFGFGMDNHGEWRHYWTKHQNTSVVCNHHQNNEAKLLKRLESEGLVHIIKQRQNITGG